MPKKIRQEVGRMSANQGDSMSIITITNQKGGCGKTVTATNLSVGLARAGKRVLVIDLDPQAPLAVGPRVTPLGGFEGEVNR
ncbi:MAG: ParA family protein [Planctomycetaceae bacterium]